MRCGAIALVLAIVVIARGALAADSPAVLKILTTIKTDSSFKVRMQAIRVLMKQIDRSGPASDSVMETLAHAATKDDEHLVRGLACYALGQLADPRAKPTLELALKDEDAFVRAQAEEANKAIAKVLAKASEPAGVTTGKRRVLVIATEASPGVTAPPELVAELEKTMGTELQSQAEGYTIVSGAQGFGYKLAGTIAERNVAPQDGGGNKITIGVKITISTVPENNLRHVLSAKASAAAKGSPAALTGVETKVLRAAVSRAVKDSLAAISIE